VLMPGGEPVGQRDQDPTDTCPRGWCLHLLVSTRGDQCLRRARRIYLMRRLSGSCSMTRGHKWGAQHSASGNPLTKTLRSASFS
jgi:hypothetical protein